MKDQRDPAQPEPGLLQSGRESDAALNETIAFWEPVAGRKLSREDARQIRENLKGFFRVLIEWDEAEKAREADGGAEDRAA